jgi:putative phosphotransacetylase
MTKITIEISARHVHLSQADLTKLFGRQHKLRILKKLNQRGEFAARETVKFAGVKGEIKNVRVVGPLRPKTQVELALSDAQILGIKPPLRLSGNLKGAAKIKLIGPAGQIIVPAAIIALRHLHLNPSEAKKLKLRNGQKVKIKINGARQLILDKVVVRIKPNFKLALHLDTDEANAAGWRGHLSYGELVK